MYKPSLYVVIPHSNKFLQSEKVFPSLGPLAIKSFLEQNGYHVFVEDEFNDSKIQDIADYDFIGFSATTAQWRASGREIAKQLKEKYSDKKIVVGGATATYHYDELSKDKNIDFIVMSAGEKSIKDVLNYKIKDRIINRGNLNDREFNDLPLPWRSFDYLKKYQYHIKDRRATSAVIGLYCPYGCKYCESRRSGLTLSNEKRLTDELKQIKSINFDAVMFYDDVLVINKERTELLCKVIKPMDMYFRGFGHASTVHKEDFVPYLKMLHDSGCQELCFGAESGDQRILNIVGKGNKVDWNYRTVENLLKCGITAIAFLMIGLPGENYETIAATEKFIETFYGHPNFKFDYVAYYPFEKTYIREHSEQFDIKIHHDLLEDSFGAYKQRQGKTEYMVSTSALSREDIEREHKRIINRFSKNFKGFNDANTNLVSEYCP